MSVSRSSKIFGIGLVNLSETRVLPFGSDRPNGSVVEKMKFMSWRMIVPGKHFVYFMKNLVDLDCKIDFCSRIPAARRIRKWVAF